MCRRVRWDLPGGVSNEGTSDFCHFANFHDKCLISNETVPGRGRAGRADTREAQNRVLGAIKSPAKIMGSQCRADAL